MPVLQSVKYERGKLEVLDQLRIPQEMVYVGVAGTEAAWAVIRSMQVRGAPLIAIVAALGLAVEAEGRQSTKEDFSAVKSWLLERTAYLRTSRPTAVNLFNAMDDLDAAIRASNATSPAELLELVVVASERLFAEDLAMNKAIGEAGADAVLLAMEKSGCGNRKARVVTICNTGSLATTGWGTALGVIRSLHARDKLEHVYCLETRPYNQGSRLTAFEIVTDELPGTLICDSMAAALMLRKGVDACVVGADRVVSNGDTANKIGTYSLSILAQYHKVPFFVALTTTGIDLTKATGCEIPIEDRPADELRCLAGQRLAPENISVWNPSFDVAPASLITGIVTERGCIKKKGDGATFDVAAIMASPSESRKRASNGDGAVKPQSSNKQPRLDA